MKASAFANSRISWWDALKRCVSTGKMIPTKAYLERSYSTQHVVTVATFLGTYCTNHLQVHSGHLRFKTPCFEF